MCVFRVLEGDYHLYLTTGPVSGEDKGANDEGATKAQVYCMFFGEHGDSGPIPLGLPGGEYFQTGATDKFEVRQP